MTLLSLYLSMLQRCPECRETCGPASLAGLLNDQDWQALSFLAAEILVQSEGRIFCPYPECSAPLLPAAGHGCSTACYSIECPHCRRYGCMHQKSRLDCVKVLLVHASLCTAGPQLGGTMDYGQFEGLRTETKQHMKRRPCKDDILSIPWQNRFRAY